MATANRGGMTSHKSWTRVALMVALTGVVAAWYFGASITGYAQAGTAYGAKTACSCRYISGRDLGSCEQDFVPGMEAVFLSDNVDEKAVTATIPLVASTRATYHDGFGCLLEPWEE